MKITRIYFSILIILFWTGNLKAQSKEKNNTNGSYYIESDFIQNCWLDSISSTDNKSEVYCDSLKIC